MCQAALTLFQYAKKSKRGRFGRLLLALLGLGPLMEGASVWMGKEDKELNKFKYTGRSFCFSYVPQIVKDAIKNDCATSHPNRQIRAHL